MPWTKSFFGMSASAWDLIRLSFELLSHSGGQEGGSEIFLVFLLLTLPICSLIVIINDAKTLNENRNTSSVSKVITVIVVILLIIILIGAQSQNQYSSFVNILDILGIGFYLTLLGAGYFLFDLLTVQTDTIAENGFSSKNRTYCSNCGEQYNANSAGQFCEHCGNQLDL